MRVSKVFFFIFAVIISIFICDTYVYAVVPWYEYKAGIVNYDEDGFASFGYESLYIYQVAYNGASFSDSKRTVINNNLTFDNNGSKYYNLPRSLYLDYGDSFTPDYLPKAAEVTTYINYYNVSTSEVPITWDVAIPEDLTSHPEGFEYKVTGNVEGNPFTYTISVFPNSTLNKPASADGLKFKDGKQIDGDITYSVRKASKGDKYFLNDGSYLASGTAVIDGSSYTFVSDGSLRKNEYWNNYFYEADGKRNETLTYAWGSDGDYKIYADSNGNRLFLSYAMIDDELCFFDGNGYQRQVFGYPTYNLAKGHVLLGVPVQFDQTGKEEIIKRITEIRQEAVNLGVIKNLVVPKWSYELERGNMIRACEAALFPEAKHSRPTKDCAELVFGNYYDASECCLAWGNGSTLRAIEMYYSEKEDLLNKTGGVTGHYTNMLTSYHIGTASVGFDDLKSGSWDSSNAYGRDWFENVASDETKVNFDKYSIQLIEIDQSQLNIVKDTSVSSKIRGATVYTYGLNEYRKVMDEGKLVKKGSKYMYEYFDKSYAKNKWISINGKDYYFDDKGNGLEYKSGSVIKDYNITYKITDIKKQDGFVTSIEAIAQKIKKGTKSAYINDFWMGDVKLSVTKIGDKFAKNNRTLNYVSIGENVKTIGKQAFYGCKSLNTINIYGSKLKENDIKNQAFKKTPKKITIYCPKKCINKYKKLLIKKGISKKAKYKKL